MRKHLIEEHLKIFNNTNKYLNQINDSFMNTSKEISNKYLSQL